MIRNEKYHNKALLSEHEEQLPVGIQREQLLTVLLNHHPVVTTVSGQPLTAAAEAPVHRDIIHGCADARRPFCGTHIACLLVACIIRNTRRYNVD